MPIDQELEERQHVTVNIRTLAAAIANADEIINMGDESLMDPMAYARFILSEPHIDRVTIGVNVTTCGHRFYARGNDGVACCVISNCHNYAGRHRN